MAAARKDTPPSGDGAPERGQLDEVRVTNRALILALASQTDTVSCPLLAKRSGLSRQTVYLIAAELEQAGVLVGDGIGRSSGGRRPKLLRYQPQSWGAIGVETREHEACAVLTDLNGTVVQRLAGPLRGTTPADVADVVEALTQQLRATMPAGRVLGIGVALPGLVDVERGIVRMSVLYDWTDVPLADMLRVRTGLPAYVASRPAAAALGEARTGAGRGAQRLVYLFAGPSLGIGLAMDGDLYHGTTSSAGEFGHMTILPDGPRCACGNHGCLNAVASGNALLTRARVELTAHPRAGESLRRRYGPDLAQLRTLELAEEAANGDRFAGALLEEAGRSIGIAAANVINLLNPDYFLIGGPMAAAGALLLDAVREEARQRSLASLFQEVQFAFGALGADSEMVGAAALVLRDAPRLLAPASD